MHAVLVSSPGCTPALHWSHAFAGQLAEQLVGRRVSVSWLGVLRPGQVLAPAPAGVERLALPMSRAADVARVAAENRHLPVELALTRVLRDTAARVVVHIGIGARGSPNVNWLAERLGAVPFAVARSTEVVCQRGDLVDWRGGACDDFRDAERCRRCCSGSWWRRPRADAFRNRGDLLAGSLLASAAVFVPDEEGVRRLVAFGLPPASLVVADDAAGIAARVVAGGA